MLVTSYNGFESEPFGMFVNAPYRTVTAQDQVTQEDWKLADQPWSTNGWYTRFNYKTLDLCDETLSSHDMNEHFGVWNDDYYAATGTHNSWTPPDCAVNPQSYTCGFTVDFDQWIDEMSFGCPGSDCTPLPMHPGADSTKVQSAMQVWRVGTGAPGGGFAVQVNTHQRYRDEGWHENVASPVP